MQGSGQIKFIDPSKFVAEFQTNEGLIIDNGEKIRNGKSIQQVYSPSFYFPFPTHPEITLTMIAFRWTSAISQWSTFSRDEEVNPVKSRPLGARENRFRRDERRIWEGSIIN